MAHDVRKEIGDAALHARGMSQPALIALCLGVPGVLSILVALLFLPRASLLDYLRWLDSGICAQVFTHSFYAGGELLPLCARNTGIYLGFIVTLITLFAVGRGRVQQLPSRPVIIVLACGVIALAFDGLNSFFADLDIAHPYQPLNLLRLATGLATGLALATLTLPILNRLFWCEYNEKCSIPSWKALLLLFPGLLVSFFAVASQSMIVLYPLALLSTAGLLTVLCSVNVIVILTIAKREQTFKRYREFLLFFGVALICALTQLAVLAQLKMFLLHMLKV